MDCYGRNFGRRAECPKCKLGSHCRLAADPPLLSMHPPAGADFTLLNELEAEKSSAEKADGDRPEERYSRADLLEVIGFMMALDATTLEFLDAKLGDPDVSFSKLARRRNVSRQAVHKFIREKCEKIPELAAVMRNRSQRKKNHSTPSFMEEVCLIRKKVRERRSKQPKAASTCSKSLTCWNRSFDLSNMSMIKGEAIWRNG